MELNTSFATDPSVSKTNITPKGEVILSHETNVISQ